MSRRLSAVVAAIVATLSAACTAGSPAAPSTSPPSTSAHSQAPGMVTTATPSPPGPAPQGLSPDTTSDLGGLRSQPGVRIAQAYDMPAQWHVDNAGIWTDRGYAAFEAATADSSSGSVRHSHELWIAGLQDGRLRRIPAQVSDSTMATVAMSGGSITRVEKTPRPDSECYRSDQAGCWTWKLYAIAVPDGTPVLLAQSTHAVNQISVPLVESYDGLFAWQQTSDQGGGVDVMAWTPGQPAPHRLAHTPGFGILHVDSGHVYIEQSTLKADGSSSDSTISVIASDGGLSPVARYQGPCCVDMQGGRILYMTGDRAGQGAVSVATTSPGNDQKLEGTSPFFQGTGIYWAFAVDADRAVISSVKGDYLVNLSGHATAIELTHDGPAHVLIRPTGGQLAGVVTDAGGRETWYVLAPQH